MDNTTRPCEFCGTPLTPRQKRCCGAPACKKAQLCANTRAWRDAGNTGAHETRTCEVCGEEFQAQVYRDTRLCSRACVTAYNIASGAMDRASQAAHAKRPKVQPKVKLTPQEITELHKSQRSPLRAAYEDQDWTEVAVVLRAMSTPTEAGCWQYSRLAADGYPRPLKWGSSAFPHRIACEVRYRKPLGLNQAHHTCANRACVNPEHMQAISGRENMAEMLQRNYYIARIRELEAALAAVDPSNTALGVVSVDDVG